MSVRIRRLCYVIPSLGIGGTERQLLYLMRGLADDYDLLTVCTNREGALAGDARRLGTVRVLGSWGGWDFRNAYRLGEVFRSYRPDIVHTFMFGFDHPVAVAARKAGVPVVISSRRELATWKEPRHVRLQRRANTLVDCIVANSQAVADHAIKQESGNPDQYRVIRNGVDPNRFMSHRDAAHIRAQYDIPLMAQVVGLVANFSPVKDHELFVEIVAELARRRGDLHFVMVGNGPLRERIGRLVQRKGLSDRVTGLTTVAELPDLYKLMDVAVLCSKVEGCPNVLLEAMTTRTPVVAAEVGGIPEIVSDKDTGRLVSSRKPQHFADAVEWVLKDPDRSQAMAERASRYVTEAFSVEKMVSAHRKLYAELVAGVKASKTQS